MCRMSYQMPFVNRSAWASIQIECSDLRRTHAHLVQGTRPSKKISNICDVKRYLDLLTVAKDGLLVVSCVEPLSRSGERIVVPRQVLSGLITSLHLKLDRPSCHQLKLAMQRYFYVLDMDKAIQQTTLACHQCAALCSQPNCVTEQSTGDPPASVGCSFAANVVRRIRQFILVVRECVTSFTSTCLLTNGRHDTLRDSLVRMCLNACR